MSDDTDEHPDADKWVIELPDGHKIDPTTDPEGTDVDGSTPRVNDGDPPLRDPDEADELHISACGAVIDGEGRPVDADPEEFGPDGEYTVGVQGGETE